MVEIEVENRIAAGSASLRIAAVDILKHWADVGGWK
jgi:hypothetical protein